MADMTTKQVIEGLLQISEVAGSEYAEWLENRLTKIEEKAEKDRERRAAKRAESDVLRQRIADVLTEEPQTADQIVAALAEEFEDLTGPKVTNRLTTLIKEGKASKSRQRVDGAYKTIYAVAGVFESVEE